MSPPTDPPSSAASAAENTRWFAEQVQPHGAHLKGYLHSAFPAVRDVDDVIQESYLRVWKRHATQPIESVKAFLFKVARRLALDTLRHERRSPIDRVTDFEVYGVMEENVGIADSACINEEMDLLLTAIEALPRRCREIFILRKVQSVSQKEIARRLGISEHTVEAQIGRANRACEEFLRQRGVIRSPRL